MTTAENAFTFGEWVGHGIDLIVHMLKTIPGIVMLFFAVVMVISGFYLVSGEGRPSMTEALRDSMCAELGVVLPHVGEVGTMTLTGARAQVTVSRFYHEPDWYYYDKSVETRNVFCHHILRARVFEAGEYTLLGVDVSEIEFP